MSGWLWPVYENALVYRVGDVWVGEVYRRFWGRVTRYEGRLVPGPSGRMHWVDKNGAWLPAQRRLHWAHGYAEAGQ